MLKSSAIDALPVAKITYNLPCMNGDPRNIYSPMITSWRQDRQCAYCGNVFSPKYVAQKYQRFCGRSCSARWRMSQPEIIAKVHSPEVASRRGKSRSAWLRSGNPKALKELDRISKLKPMKNQSTRDKVSSVLKAMNHKPSVRGGNGKGMTVPQQLMIDVLAGNWIAEFSISLGKRQQGFPTCYKVDIGHPGLKIAIEVDGNSHYSRKEKDKKKDVKLASLGWTVLRFWNKDILGWIEAGMERGTHISMTLEQHGVGISRQAVKNCESVDAGRGQQELF